jgi:L-ascorbate metabolism protein UlaG (beta-lactamase superfamily)
MPAPAKARSLRARGSRALALALAALGAGLALAVMKCGCAAHRGPVSDHFDGTRFFNREGRYSRLEMLRWFAQMETVDWPRWIEDQPQPPPPRRVGRGGLRVTYVNHATVLVQMEGLAILTDPIWSSRAGPSAWIGAKRVRAPGVRFELLPPIDYVLLSHDHYDHLDLATIEKLERRDHPTFVAGLGVKALLESRGVRSVVELDWWQTHEREGDGVRIAFVPARHGSGRGPLSRDRTLWGGFVIEAPSGQVYFAGDTALGAFVADVAAAFRRIRLAILPIGSYEKRWFMRTQHMNPDEAVQVHGTVAAFRSAGMHFGTFAEHPEQAIDAPEKDLAAALRRRSLPPSTFWVLAFGEGRDVPPLPGASVPGPQGSSP